MTLGPPDAGDQEHFVRRAARGDRAAQRALFVQYQRGIMGYCLLSSRGDRERALDLVQETFLRAFRALPRLQEPARFRSWLFAIAANLSRERHAGDALQREALAAAHLDLDLPQSEEARHREDRIALVQKVLASLQDEGLRQVVSLKYTDPEHTTREIAEKLGLPHGTVTSRLVRFRAGIRRELVRAFLKEGVS